MAPSLSGRIWGVDFSGAADAGRRIWIARGEAVGGALHVTRCFRAEDLTGAGGERSLIFAALRDFIARQRDCAVGLDFPFGLPQRLVKEESWEEFVLSFPGCYAGPEEFRQKCLEAAGGKELKRVGEQRCRAPFSPYNLRLYRQTYYGIREVLHPLVKEGLACVLPVQEARPWVPWLVEVCPAATLKAQDLYLPYKGRGKEREKARAAILEALEGRGVLAVRGEVKELAVRDAGGDALDSILCALAAWWAVNGCGNEEGACRLEGWVYY
ncbi:DUF429 domain-containing protein [Desulfovirgula thermocuniculi]|uniref:DUF429 domain-containing protein n=1 Tax=Desulfovirgula thermocuniculi TaxID=348842 RepID=UPI000485DCAC|nr:DUF429 domain-containing protein [Desulfovirgula thermocuniculi]